MKVEVAFDAPESSSDGGLLLLRQADDRIGLSRWFASCLRDDRDPDRVVHERLEQVMQRVYQIACGYEDCNDADSLRHDPLLKTVCDRTPKDREGLSSQPTLSRFENSVRARDVVRLVHRFEDEWVASLPAGTDAVTLDVDATDDETHGRQQLSFFHGYYDEYMYHPLLLFDGEGRLVSFMLRPGNTHASRRAAPLLERVIRKIKRRFPCAQVTVRADSGFCVPRVHTMLERLNEELGDVEYLLGMAKNDVLLALAKDAMSEAEELYKNGHRTVRHFTDFFYAAQTWEYELWLVAKAEHSSLGANPRFVVSSLLGFPPRMIYDAYCERGESENYIKELKNALQADRLSCESFVANAFRLCLYAAAYRLMYAVRERAAQVSPSLGHRQFDTLRLRLLKVAAIVSESMRRILVRLPRAYPLQHVFGGMLAPAPG
jgi:hypothetical protein